MNIDHRNPRLRRGFAFVALAALLGLSAVGLTQCRMVDDTVTGVDARSGVTYHGGGDSDDSDDSDGDDDDSDGGDSDDGRGRSACEQQCNKKFKRCVREEDARHKEERKRCNRLPTSAERSACKKAENDRHTAAIKECRRQKMLCKQRCRYREGAGSAGR